MWVFNRFRGDEIQRQIRRLDLGHKPHEVRAAMLALRDIGERAVPPLLQILCNQGEPSIFRCRVADTLTWIKDERAVEPLIATLSDSDEQVRWSALQALEELGEQRAIPELERMAASDEGEFTIPGGFGKPLHIVLKDEARKALEKIDRGAKR